MGVVRGPFVSRKAVAQELGCRPEEVITAAMGSKDEGARGRRTTTHG